MNRSTFIFNIAKVLGAEQDHSLLAMLDSKLEHWMRSYYRLLVTNRAQEAEKLISDVTKTYSITTNGWIDIVDPLVNIFDCIECGVRLHKVLVTPPSSFTKEARYLKVLDRKLYNDTDPDLWVYTISDNKVYIHGFVNLVGNVVVKYYHYVFVPFDNMHIALQDGLYDYILSQLAPVIYARQKAARKEDRKRDP